MSTFPQLATHPGMNPAAVIQGDRWRIGIITESLVRLEWQDNGKFEDHATQMIVNRDWLSDDANGADGANRADSTSNPPKFTKTERDGCSSSIRRRCASPTTCSRSVRKV